MLGAFLSVETMILLSFFTLLLIMATIGVLVFRNTHEMERSIWWVDRSQEIIERLKELELNLGAAESALHAYMVTGDVSWRAEYQRQAVQELDSHLTEIRRLTADLPQIRRLNNIEPLIRRRVELFENIRKLHETEPGDKARESELLGKDAAETKHLAALFQEFMERENNVLASRVLKRELDARFVNDSIIACVVTAYLWGGVALLLIFRSLRSRNRTREQLEVALKEKEMLLKEVHHRVKNNLQVISSLLSLKSEKLKNPEAAQVCNECCNTIYLMARLHQQVYTKGQFAWVDFGEHVGEIAEMLVRSQNPANCEVALQVHSDPTIVPSEMAVPLGIIASELILNSLKHGFYGRKTGAITIEFHDGGRREIVIRDNGVGLPEGFDPQNGAGLGLELVFGLTRQIRCETVLENSPEGGVCTTIRFPPMSREESDEEISETKAA